MQHNDHTQMKAQFKIEAAGFFRFSFETGWTFKIYIKISIKICI